ncbi:MAG: hypothetical protein V4580_15005 [Bacteroidota bacterium]
MLFINYFEMQDAPTADETGFYGGLIIIIPFMIALWVCEFFIYSRASHPTRNYYLSLWANIHYVFFILLYVISYLYIELANPDNNAGGKHGFMIMSFMFCLLLGASVINIYQFFFVKKASLNK